MAINIVGSFAMGLFIATLMRRGGSNEVRLFVATGILGGFTTFSAFSLDFATLWERGATLPAFGYALASVLGAIFALFVGFGSQEPFHSVIAAPAGPRVLWRRTGRSRAIPGKV